MTASSLAETVCQTAFTERDLRNALGQFATGVTVVTALQSDGSPLGMTVSSFNSVSLTPALVLWSLGRQTGHFDAWTQCTHYNIHVLAAHQKELALQFSRRGIDRFANVLWTPNEHGIPLLNGALATFECEAHQHHEAGDHLIMVGQVLRCLHTSEAAPLLYHRGVLNAAA